MNGRMLRHGGWTVSTGALIWSFCRLLSSVWKPVSSTLPNASPAGPTPESSAWSMGPSLTLPTADFCWGRQRVSRITGCVVARRLALLKGRVAANIWRNGWCMARRRLMFGIWIQGALEDGQAETTPLPSLSMSISRCTSPTFRASTGMPAGPRGLPRSMKNSSNPVQSMPILLAGSGRSGTPPTE